MCNTKRTNPHQNHAAGYPHIQWTRPFKVKGLVYGHRNATDILTESCTHLAEAKSHGLTHMLICKATQTGKCWDEIKGILRLKLCNANIHTCTSCFMEIQQKDNETLAAYIHCFKTAAKQCAFDNDTAAIHIFVKGLRDAHSTAAKIYEEVPQTLAEVIKLVEKLNVTQ